jgi:hypothetical protein
MSTGLPGGLLEQGMRDGVDPPGGALTQTHIIIILLSQHMQDKSMTHHTHAYYLL